MQSSGGQTRCEAQGSSVDDLSLTLDGARLHYLHAGSGPALLLVHGLLGYSFSWRHTVPVLARNAAVYAPDLPGAGFSDAVPGMDCCFQACAKRLLRFMDAVGASDCDLLGTSHGGAVAMMAAATAPQRIRRLILVDPVNPWSAHGRSLSVWLSNPVIAPAFERIAPRLAILQKFYLRRLFADTRRIQPGTLEGYIQPLRRRGALKYGLNILRSWNRDLAELQSAFPRISAIPTLLIWGSRDAAVDPASAARLQSQFQDCQLLMFEGVGHLPYEEVPEEFNRAVSQFLARKDVR
jgi:pimeloyl-ACP methyl ester carboxylesterase